ncbi:ABC transporter substrate-binding protein [Pseudoduganella namucuonensis]|uniref:Amino acid/amide ABC transporter substrate-binding protein, HAAT family n=1 Tax=Pseudoduganella namucuonensis TaxID=1035707 RepID=A0A1I7JW66_9BURK|nr:ABC transporter substrate-binding protein [Pseudoduganella namucuonensis]SFU89414.1 amino acid/amide ABC transporter substrate-binding protein, HAAT family [Pseudoduganella namucuonensis]
MFTNFLKKSAIAAAMLLAAGSALAQNIKIGSVLSVSGPAAFLGDPELKTLQMYVEKINAEGGVLGRKLELVHYDDGSDAAKANGFTKRLIESDKVDVLIGGTTTGATMAMAPLVDKAGLPFISLAGAVVIIDPVKKWVFKTPHTDRMAAEKVFEDMKKRGIAKVGLLSETSGFGASGRKESQAVASKYGITLVADETYGPKDTDVTAQLTRIKNTAGVQAVFVFGLGQGPAVVTKNYGQLAMTALPMYQSHGVASDEYIKLSGKAAEGVRLPTPSLLIGQMLPAGDAQKAIVTGYDKAYRDRYKVEPSTFGGYALDALNLSVDAIKRAGGTDKEKVRSALELTKGFVGTTGVFNMSAADHMGLDLSAFRMVEVKNGDWQLLK